VWARGKELLGLRFPRVGWRVKARTLWRIARQREVAGRPELQRGVRAKVRAMAALLSTWVGGGRRWLRNAVFVWGPGYAGEAWRGLSRGGGFDWAEPRRAGEVAYARARQCFRERAAVAWWVAASAACVAVMVVVGGVTRLTKSGLSMTEWRLTGEQYPASDADWHDAFGKYRASPEGVRVNPDLTLEEFKFIYYVEWLHRRLGRWTGLVYGVPLLAFCVLGVVRPRATTLGRRLIWLLAAGGSQGLVGWWMVRSGLEDGGFRVQEADIPRVSPYRLAFHLTMAFGIYAGLVWTALGLFAGPSRTIPLAVGFGRAAVAPVAALVGVTAIAGAFVAGLEAGHAFNDWPLMNGVLFRPVEELTALEPAWRNVFENTALVQTDHRLLAYSTLVASLSLALAARALGVHPYVRRLAAGVALVACAQASLGVATLVNHVPVELGSAHQAGALLLFTVTLATLHAAVGTRLPLHGRADLGLGPAGAAGGGPLAMMMRRATGSASTTFWRIHGGPHAPDQVALKARKRKLERNRVKTKRRQKAAMLAAIEMQDAKDAKMAAEKVYAREQWRPKRPVWSNAHTRSPGEPRVTPPAFPKGRAHILRSPLAKADAAPKAEVKAMGRAIAKDKTEGKGKDTGKVKVKVKAGVKVAGKAKAKAKAMAKRTEKARARFERRRMTPRDAVTRNFGATGRPLLNLSSPAK